MEGSIVHELHKIEKKLRKCQIQAYFVIDSENSSRKGLGVGRQDSY